MSVRFLLCGTCDVSKVNHHAFVQKNLNLPKVFIVIESAPAHFLFLFLSFFFFCVLTNFHARGHFTCSNLAAQEQQIKFLQAIYSLKKVILWTD